MLYIKKDVETVKIMFYSKGSKYEHFYYFTIKMMPKMHRRLLRKPLLMACYQRSDVICGAFNEHKGHTALSDGVSRYFECWREYTWNFRANLSRGMKWPRLKCSPCYISASWMSKDRLDSLPDGRLFC